MRHLDLFSGIGGFALAAKWAGIETVAFCEKDEFCRKVLTKHWPDVVIHHDIKNFSYENKIDILTAGFPCQPFSVAGKKKGFSDDRYLWPETIRLIKQCRPDWLILENVPGIVAYLDPILKELEEESYLWRAFIIPASAIGAPHKRERIWIIANTDSLRCHDGENIGERGHLQDDWKRYVEEIQSEWSQFFPQSWETFNAQEWLGFIADPNGEQCSEKSTNQEAISERYERQNSIRKAVSLSAPHEGQKDQPPIPGVDDGIPYIVDRNKAIGNSIVPQIPFLFMKIIKNLTNQH